MIINKNSKILKFIASVVVSAALLFFLAKTLNGFDWRKISNIFTVDVIAVSIIFYLLIKVVNTCRYNFVFETNNFFITLNILLFSNFILNLLPFRLGELSYLGLFKQHYKVDYKKGMLNIIYLRIIDYFSIFVFMLFSFVVMVYKNQSLLANKPIMIFVALMIMLMLLLSIIILLIKRRNNSTNIIQKIINYFYLMKERNYKYKISIIFFSLVYWFLRFSFGIYLFWVVGIKIGFFELFFISTLTMLVSLIPIQTFAGFGIFEGTWTAAFLLFNVEKQDLLNQIVSVHLMTLLTIVVFGIISVIILYILTQNKYHHTYLKKYI